MQMTQIRIFKIEDGKHRFLIPPENTDQSELKYLVKILENSGYKWSKPLEDANKKLKE